MHTDYRRNVRVLAPVQLVWDEVSDLHAILSKSMQFLTYDLAADGGSARFRANLTWGPLKYAIEGTATVDEARPRELTRYVVRVPQLEMRYSAAQAPSTSMVQNLALRHRSLLTFPGDVVSQPGLAT